MSFSIVHQTTSHATDSGSGAAYAIPSTTAGNCLVVCVNADLGVSGITLGGSAGNFEQAEASSSNVDSEIWIDPDCAGGQTALVISAGGSAGEPLGTQATIYELSGAVTSSPLDQAGSNSFSGTAWTVSTGGATSQASEIVFALVTDANGSTITGPGGGWTNTAFSGSGSGFASMAGYLVLSSAGTPVYDGTFSASDLYDAVIITLKGSGSSPAPSPFTPPRSAKGKPSARRGTHAASPGARYTAFPSKFTQPARPARGAPSARRGTHAASPGAPYVHVVPPGPSPFTPPRTPARGRPAAVRGTSRSSPGAAFVLVQVSPFTPPPRPARGAQAARRGTARSLPGAPYTAFPSPFTAPRKPARGRAAAVRGRSASSPGAPFTPQQRTLLISLASKAGTDDYANAFPQGILATAGVISGPVFEGTDFIINSAGAFFYSATPASGNLVASVTRTSGTDSFGNPYQAGFTAYDNANSTWAQLDSGAVNFSNGAVVSNAVSGLLNITNGGIGIVINANTGEIALNAGTVNADGNNVTGIFGVLDPSGYPLSGSATLGAVITTLNSTIQRLQAIGIFL